MLLFTKYYKYHLFTEKKIDFIYNFSHIAILFMKSSKNEKAT